jgi:NitT/TauT family transport system substrate-binding protein
MPHLHNRREFVAGLSIVAATGFLAKSPPAAAEPPPEVTRIRTSAYPKVSDCATPFYAAEELLRLEGFTEVEFIVPANDAEGQRLLPEGKIDIESWDAPILLGLLNKGVPLKVLGGMHAGCLELLAAAHVTSVKDLRGKRVGVNQLNGLTYNLLSLMTAHVGLDPKKEIEWVTTANALDELSAGRIDAFLATPPDPQIARERKIGHVILSTALDRPWSQYYCCLFDANVDFVRNYPVATKRALRALLKSADLCVSDPEGAVRRSEAKGFAASAEYTLQALKDARYGVWRDYDPEDTLRFYALRMKELGMISATPQQIIAEGTDFRFFNELKRELKS